MKSIVLALVGVVGCSFLFTDLSEARAIRFPSIKFDGSKVDPPKKQPSRVLAGLRKVDDSYSKLLRARKKEIEADLANIKAQVEASQRELLAATSQRRGDAKKALAKYKETQARLKAAQREAEAARDKLAADITRVETEQAREKLGLQKTRGRLGAAKSELAQQETRLGQVRSQALWITKGEGVDDLAEVIGGDQYQDARRSAASAQRAVASASKEVADAEAQIGAYSAEMAKYQDAKTSEMASIAKKAEELEALDQQRDQEVAKIRTEQEADEAKYRAELAKQVEAYRQTGGKDASKAAPLVITDGVALFPADSSVELSADFKDRKAREKVQGFLASQRENDLYAELMFMDMDQLEEELKDNQELLAGIKAEVLGLDEKSKNAFKKSLTGLAVQQMLNDFGEECGCTKKKGVKAAVEAVRSINEGETKSGLPASSGKGGTKGGQGDGSAGAGK